MLAGFNPILGVLSGILVSLLGLWLLAQRSAERGATPFGAFALVWGASAVAANVEFMLHAPTRLSVLGHGLAILAPPYLMAFAVTASGWTRRRESIVSGLALAVAGVGALALAIRPSLFVRSPTDLADTAYPSAIGPLAYAVELIPLYLALAATIHLFLARSERGESVAEARRHLLVAAGFALFLAYTVPWFGLRFAGSLSTYLAARGPAETALTGILYLLAASALARFAWRVHVSPRIPRWERRRILAAYYVLLGLGASAAFAMLAGLPTLDLVGLCRVLLVALIVVAILQHRLFHGDLRLRRALLLGISLFVGAAVALAAGGAVAAVDASILDEPLGAAALGAVFAATASLAHLPVSRAWFQERLRGWVDPPDPAGRHSLETYRAALETRIAQGRSIDPSDPELRRLRAELGLQAGHHETLALFLSRATRAPRFTRGERILGGTYTVLREIGEGSSARVYECVDEAGRSAAIKVAPPLAGASAERGARAIREARILRQLRSENVLPIVDLADRPEAFYVVTEHAAGGTLADLIARAPEGRMDVGQAITTAREILQGLSSAHAAGIVHADLKPENILLASGGRVLVADFESAAVSQDALAGMRGTPAWLAPECLHGAAASMRADVFAVGAILHRLLTGSHYLHFDGLTLDEARVLAARAPYRPPERVPAQLAAFLETCMAKDPQLRYADAGTALKALGDVPT